LSDKTWFLREGRGLSLEKCINTPDVAVGELKAIEFVYGKMHDLGNTVPKKLPAVGSKTRCNRHTSKTILHQENYNRLGKGQLYMIFCCLHPCVVSTQTMEHTPNSCTLGQMHSGSRWIYSSLEFLSLYNDSMDSCQLLFYSSGFKVPCLTQTLLQRQCAQKPFLQFKVMPRQWKEIA